jgi:predicted MFS family arabinose efflux permease
MAAGAALTFVPLALGHAPSVIAPLALLAQPAAGTVARWQAGRYGDRHDPARLLLPGVALTAIGVLAVAVTLVACPAAVIAAMALFGIGFGIVQNSTLALMYGRCDRQGLDTASAMWNVAYDAGLGLGAAGFGVLAAHGRYPVAFAISAALVLVALAPARRDRLSRRGRPGR